MEYRIILIEQDTKLDLSSLDLSQPIEFKFNSGDGHQVKDICDFELSIHNKNEIEKNDTINYTFRLNLKKLPLDIRINIIKKALVNKDLLDSTLLLNIFNLIKGYNNYDSSFFESSDIAVNSLIEFIDMKNKLKAELTLFSKELAKYFYSIFRSVGVTDFPANNLPEVIPFIYQRLFLIADFISISNIIRKFSSIENLVYVENAESFLQALSSRYIFANLLMKNIGLTQGE